MEDKVMFADKEDEVTKKAKEQSSTNETIFNISVNGPTTDISVSTKLIKGLVELFQQKTK